MEVVRALGFDFLGLTIAMLVTYGCLCLIEILAPRTSFDASSQVRSLRFWPYYMAALVACSYAGKAILSRWPVDPLIKIDGQSLYEASHLGLFNYVVWPVLGIILLDFFHYWKHRAQHKFFWNYHSIHHSIENLSAVNSYHHWTDPIFSLALVAIPMGLLIGMNIPTLAVVSGLLFLQGAFIHSSTRLHLGIADRLLVDNRFHRIHHSVEERHFDKNFGERTTVWDQLFGTAYFPEPDEWPRTGISGTPEPRRTADYFWAPFKKQHSADVK